MHNYTSEKRIIFFDTQQHHQQELKHQYEENKKQTM